MRGRVQKRHNRQHAAEDQGRGETGDEEETE